MSSKRPASFNKVVLADPRWEALASGEISLEDVADLQAWAARSEAAKAAWIAFQPVTEERIDGLAKGVLQRLDARSKKPSFAGGKGGVSVRVYLIDDHPVLRDSLARALDAEPGMTVVGQASTAAEALREIPMLEADVAIVDLNLPDRDGIELLAALRTQVPRAKLLVLSGYDDEYRVIEALRAGARGYLVKTSEVAEVIDGIQRVALGESPLSPRIAGAVVRGMRKPTAEGSGGLDTLTNRERQVLQLLATGMSTRETASRLTISPKTVESHRSRIYKKLGCKSAVELTRIAVRMRLIEP